MNNYGIRFPMQFSKANSIEQFDNIAQYLKFCVKLMFLTSPKEKLNDLYYGIDLRKYLFDKQTDENYSELKSQIIYQFKRNMPHVQIGGVEIIESPGGDANACYVSVKYSIPSINLNDSFDLLIHNGA